MEPKEIKFTLRIVYQGPEYEDPNPPEEDEAAKKKPSGKGAAAEEPKIRMITPEPVLMEQEHGRVFALELGQHCKFLHEEKQEEANQLKEQGQEVPEDFYYTKWVRFFADQRLIPATNLSSEDNSAINVNASPTISTTGGEETKVASRSKIEPTLPVPHEDMIVKFQS